MIWIILLTAADVLIALLLIALVLVQQSKEGAFGSPFGGVGESVFGAQATGHLAKMTVVFAAMFLIITLFLAIIIGHMGEEKSIMDKKSVIKPNAPETQPLDIPPPVTGAKKEGKPGAAVPSIAPEKTGAPAPDAKGEAAPGNK